MAITAEKDQDIRIEDVRSVRVDFNAYDADIVFEVPGGSVTVTMDVSSRKEISDLAREIYGQIDAEFGFSEEEDDEE